MKKSRLYWSAKKIEIGNISVMSTHKARELDESQVFMPIRLLDLDVGEVLEFDTYVFLPTNNRYVKISQTGEFLNAEKIDKIKLNKINMLYVSSEQIQKFYSYSASKLRKMGSSKKLKKSERTAGLVSSVRELMTDLFSLDSSKLHNTQNALKNCSEIISSYILQGPEPDWFVRVQEALSELGDQYSHSGNVSTLAALFSIGTCIGKPEDLALAGLLHDIGKVQLMEIQGINKNAMTTEQMELNRKHPELSMELLMQKKIMVSDSVSRVILQHHELFNGSGFPKGLFGDQICMEAQILSFADHFERLTAPAPQGDAMSPREAVMVLRNEQSEDPSKGKYHPDLLRDLLYLLPV